MSRHPIALLGAGIFAREAHLPAILKAEKLELKAIYSRSFDSAKELAEHVKPSPVPFYTGDGARSEGTLDDLLKRDDIMTVVVCLPITVQPDVILKALEAGKHVVSEKPVGATVDIASKLIETYETKFKPRGQQWIVAEQFPYEPAFVKLREIVQHDIGELRSFRFDAIFHVSKDNKYYNTAWRKTPEHQGGFLLDGGVHQIAGLRYVLGDEHVLSSVKADAALQHEHLPPQDTLIGLFKTRSGKHGSFELNVASETGMTMSFAFRGSKATVSIARSFKDGKGVWALKTERPKGAQPGPVYVQEEWIEVCGVEAEFKAFADALVAGAGSAEAKDVEARSGPRATLNDVAAIQHAIQSSEEDHSVSLL